MTNINESSKFYVDCGMDKRLKEISEEIYIAAYKKDFVTLEKLVDESKELIRLKEQSIEIVVE